MSKIENIPLLPEKTDSVGPDQPPTVYEFSKQLPINHTNNNLEQNQVVSTEQKQQQPKRFLINIGIFVCLTCCFSPLIAYGGWNLMLEMNPDHAEFVYHWDGDHLAGSLAMGCFIVAAIVLAALVVIGFTDGATDKLKNDRTFKTTSICIAILMTMAFLCLFGGACNGVLLVMSSDDTSPTRIAFASIPFVLGVLLCVCALNLTQYGHQFETNSRSLKLNLVLSVTLLIFISAFVPAMIYASMSMVHYHTSIVAAILFSLAALLICAMSAAKLYIARTSPHTNQTSLLTSTTLCCLATLVGTAFLALGIVWTVSFEWSRGLGATMLAPIFLCSIGCLLSGLLSFRV